MEMFPKSDELISITAFGKYILNPMNEVTVSSSSNDISYINTGDYGYVAGAEAEFRKQLLIQMTTMLKTFCRGKRFLFI
jgi:hypothetical protein